MTYDLLKLTLVLGAATLPLLYVSDVYLAGIKRTASKRLLDMPLLTATRSRKEVRTSLPAPVVARIVNPSREVSL